MRGGQSVHQTACPKRSSHAFDLIVLDVAIVAVDSFPRFLSRSPGVGELDGQSVLVELRRIRRNQAGKGLARRIDHIQITVGTIVPAQANIRTGSFCISGIRLQQRRQRQKSGKGVIRLETADQDRKIPAGDGETEAIPLITQVEGEPFVSPIRRVDARFIQPSVVVGPEALEEIHHQPAILGRPVSELMPSPVVFTRWNENVLVNVERGGEPLREDIHDVVVAVGSVVEFETKCALPLLRLKDMVRVWGVKYETFEVEFADPANLWPGLKSCIQVVAYAVGAFEETTSGLKLGPTFRCCARISSQLVW
jgi:hypothetical protein